MSDGHSGAARGWFAGRLGEVGTDRAATVVMAVAAVAYIPLGMWITRGAGFYTDNLIYFADSGSFSPDAVLAPIGGHLTATTRLLYEIDLRLLGPEPWLFQLQAIGMAALAAVLAFLLMRRWAGVALALPIALVLLVLGSTPDNLESFGMVWPLSVASGLGALLALEQRSGRWDAAACALLVFSVLSLEVGLMFTVAAAVLIHARRGRMSRFWIVLIPLVIYGAWWVWAQKFEPSPTSLDNLRHLPKYAIDSLASGAAAFTGIGVFDGQPEPGSSLSSSMLVWARLLMLGFLAVVFVGILRGGRSSRVGAAAVFLVLFLLAGALAYAPLFREPTAPRYVYPVVVGMILLFSASAFGWRRSRVFWLAAVAVFAVSFSLNLWLLLQHGRDVRARSATINVALAITELERGRDPAPLGSVLNPDPDGYLEALDRWGRPGYPPGELESQPPQYRLEADRLLGVLLDFDLVVQPQGSACPGRGRGAEVSLPAGRSRISSTTGGVVGLRRFGDVPTIRAGELLGGGVATIDIPGDSSTIPWVASISDQGTPGELELCAPARSPGS